MPELAVSELIDRYRRARHARAGWESTWQECYDYALPSRDSAIRGSTGTVRKSDKLFDGTAADAVDQLAASLMAELTPPWSRWFGFTTGPDVRADERLAIANDLERATTVIQSHFDRSNFAVEMHQCFLDLVTAGTACLLFEEAQPGEPSAFRFTAISLSDVVLDESGSGRLDTTYRCSQLSDEQLLIRFPRAASRLSRTSRRDPEKRTSVIEFVVPDTRGYQYVAVVDGDGASGTGTDILAEGRFPFTPFINFRWLKAPGEVYGRSPVMKALPDIKTANKVVELVLKNASIAVTGIWQADDDGVINPATIKFVPGAIIPKAVGSAGLTPLQTPGRFDVSELVLDQLRSRIRKALFVDQLGPVHGPRMTATEVLERASEMARVLGATYGRLQSELLTPLISRALAILVRRGEVADLPFPFDSRYVLLDYKAPQARLQAQRSVQNALMWLDAVSRLGPEAMAAVNQPAAARWLGRSLGVPDELILDPPAAETP